VHHLDPASQHLDNPARELRRRIEERELPAGGHLEAAPDSDGRGFGVVAVIGRRAGAPCCTGSRIAIVGGRRRHLGNGQPAGNRLRRPWSGGSTAAGVRLEAVPASGGRRRARQGGRERGKRCPKGAEAPARAARAAGRVAGSSGKGRASLCGGRGEGLSTVGGTGPDYRQTRVSGPRWRPLRAVEGRRQGRDRVSASVPPAGGARAFWARSKRRDRAPGQAAPGRASARRSDAP
jgi:hypothetical protein